MHATLVYSNTLRCKWRALAAHAYLPATAYAYRALVPAAAHAYWTPVPAAASPSRPSRAVLCPQLRPLRFQDTGLLCCSHSLTHPPEARLAGVAVLPRRRDGATRLSCAVMRMRSSRTRASCVKYMLFSRRPLRGHIQSPTCRAPHVPSMGSGLDYYTVYAVPLIWIVEMRMRNWYRRQSPSL